MSIFVLKNCEVNINDSTGFVNGLVKSVTINYESESLETTCFSSSTGIKGKTFKSGLVGWTVDLEGNQDFGSSSVDSVLFPLIGSSSFTIRICTSTTGVDETHPQFSGAAFLQSYNPVSGGVGEVASFSASFQGSGTLVRNTASCSGY